MTARSPIAPEMEGTRLKILRLGYMIEEYKIPDTDRYAVSISDTDGNQVAYGASDSLAIARLLAFIDFEDNSDAME